MGSRFHADFEDPFNTVRRRAEQVPRRDLFFFMVAFLAVFGAAYIVMDLIGL